MLKLLIIADDLTGANDTGVQFAKKGIPVFVITGAADLRSLADEFQVVAVNTESRHLPGREAAERVRTVVEQAMEAGVTHFYKKTDSSLRGNIGSELEALMKASGYHVLPFVPAFPKLNRTTRGGHHYVGDELLHQTAFGRDPLEPVEESYIPAILKRQTSVQTQVLSGASEQTQSDSIFYKEEGIYVLDATTDDDLRRAGEFLKKRGLLNAVAGSAGFAEWLPDLLEFERRPANLKCPGGNMLVISGSVNEISLKQLSHAQSHGFAAVTLPPEVLISENGPQSTLALSAIARITELGDQRRDVILRSIEKFEDVEKCRQFGRRLDIDVKHLHLRIAENLGQIAGQVLKKSVFRLVSVFGGDTLVAMVRALGWSGLLPRNEILPGITVSEVAGKEEELLLITKAGGFGQEDALTRIKDLLRSMK